MTPHWTRFALGTFAVFSTAFAANVFILQPERRPIAGPLTAPLTGESGEANAASASRVPASRSESDRARPAAAWSVQLAAHRPDGGGSGPSGGAGEDPEITRAIQRELKARGYETGTADGVADIVTRAAIMAFEADRGLTLTGEAREPLLRAIVLGAEPGPRAGATRAAEAGSQAEAVIRTVQRALITLGYRPGAVDGRLSAETISAIRQFETAQGMAQSGRISGKLVARLVLVSSRAGPAGDP